MAAARASRQLAPLRDERPSGPCLGQDAPRGAVRRSPFRSQGRPRRGARPGDDLRALRRRGLRDRARRQPGLLQWRPGGADHPRGPGLGRSRGTGAATPGPSARHLPVRPDLSGRRDPRPGHGQGRHLDLRPPARDSDASDDRPGEGLATGLDAGRQPDRLRVESRRHALALLAERGRLRPARAARFVRATCRPRLARELHRGRKEVAVVGVGLFADGDRGTLVGRRARREAAARHRDLGGSPRPSLPMAAGSLTTP